MMAGALFNPARHLAFDPRGVLLEGAGVGRELDDPLLPVERVLPPHVYVRPRHLDQVVTGTRLAAEARRRDGAGVDDEDVLEPPGVGDVLVAGEHEVDMRALEALDRIAGVVDDVPLAIPSRAPAGGGGAQRRWRPSPAGRVLLDPAVAAAADVAVVESELARVDRDDRHVVDAEDRVAVAEEVLEV